MRKLHIAFFSLPHAPHANPTLPIVNVLVRRGHRVTYITSEQYGPRLNGLGAEVICLKGWADPQPRSESPFDDRPGINVLNMDGVCRSNIRILHEAESLYKNDRPDAIIYDLVSLAGRVLAARWGVPAIQVSPQYALDNDNISTQMPNTAFRDWALAQGKKADRFLESHGVSSENFVFHREGLNIYLFPRVFQPSGTALTDERCFYAGRCVAEQSYYGNWRRTHGDGMPIALISTSTTYVRDPNYFRMCMDALSGLHWHLVLSIGDQADPAALKPIPPNVEIVQHSAHIKILRHASLFVFLAGTLSTTEAAYHGVPMIGTTFGFSEPEWCAETSIVRLGLGIHLREGELTEESLRHAAIRIAGDSDIHRNVERVSRLVRREPGAEAVVNRIEDYLAARISRG